MLFLENKYTHWYHAIVNRAKSRVLAVDTYCEKHHIIPKCLGGHNRKDNIVSLTAREHYIAHWLLTKMVENKKHKYQMWNAFSCMLYRERDGQQRYKVTGKIFENIKQEGAKIKSAKFSGVNNPMYGRSGVNSPFYGKKQSAEHLRKLTEARTGIKRSLESRQHQSAMLKGKKQSAEHIAKRIANRVETVRRNKLNRENQNA